MQHKPAQVYNSAAGVALDGNQVQQFFKRNNVPGPEMTQPLTIVFQPKTRLLEAVWQRPVSSSEYRQYIRFIGLCIAALRVEFMLVDFTKMGDPTQEDQENTNNFLKEVKKNSSLIRSARVLAKTGSQQQVHEQVFKNGPALPYQVNFFDDQEEARAWLQQPPFPKENLQSSKFAVSLKSGLKDLKKYTQHNVETPSVKQPHASIATTVVPHTAKPVTRCQTSFVTITIDQNKKLLMLRWLRRMTSREYRYAVLKTARAVINNDIRAVMVNNQHLGVINLEDQTWAVGITVSVLKKVAVERMAIVSAPDVMQQMASENMNQRLKKHFNQHKTQYFLTEDEAMDWLNLSHTDLQETT